MRSPEAQSEREFAEIMRILKERFAESDLVQAGGLGKEALPRIFQQLGGAAELAAEPLPDSKKAAPIYTELLPHRIGYWRMRSFRPAKDVDALRNQLNLWQRSGVIGLVLDVRDFEDFNNFVGAAEMASLFVPGEQPLFSIQGLQIPQQVYQSPGNTSSFKGPIVILTNLRTSGAAESFAAALRDTVGAIVVGRSTAGLGGLWGESSLSTGRFLRTILGEATLADGTPLFGHPVEPDIPLYVDDTLEREVLQRGGTTQVRSLVAELPARSRMSEAALVRNENPELDAALEARMREQQARQQARQPSRSAGSSPSPGNGEKEAGAVRQRDITLIRGMDVLRAIHVTSSQGKP